MAPANSLSIADLLNPSTDQPAPEGPRKSQTEPTNQSASDNTDTQFQTKPSVTASTSATQSPAPSPAKKAQSKPRSKAVSMAPPRETDLLRRHHASANLSKKSAASGKAKKPPTMAAQQNALARASADRWSMMKELAKQTEEEKGKAAPAQPKKPTKQSKSKANPNTLSMSVVTSTNATHKQFSKDSDGTPEVLYRRTRKAELVASARKAESLRREPELEKILKRPEVQVILKQFERNGGNRISVLLPEDPENGEWRWRCAGDGVGARGPDRAARPGGRPHHISNS
jgi:hypothetical protein